MFKKNTNKKKTVSKTNKQQSQKMTSAERQALKLQLQKARQLNATEPKNKSRFYCKPADMQAELIKWRDSNLEEDKARAAKGLPPDYTKRIISDELCKMFTAIADKLLNRSEFRNYSKELKEDAKSYFYVKAISYGLRNYNFNFNNPFSYFTTCAWNAYITVIMKHYKHQNLRKDVMSEMLSRLESYPGIDPRSSLKNYITQYLSSIEDEQSEG